MKRAALLIIPIFILSFTAQAQQSCKDVLATPEETPSGSYQELVYHYQLIRQTDPRLEKLFDEEAGFCSFACAVNVVHAFTDYQGYNPKITAFKPFRRLERLMALWEKLTGGMAGDGANLVDLATVIKMHNAERDPFGIRTRVTSPPTENSINPPRNGLVIIGVEIGGEAGHAFVSLKVDKRTQKVLLSDPQTPDVLSWVSYRIHTDSEGTRWVKLDLPKEVYGYDPMVGFISVQMLLTVNPIL